MVDAPEKFLPRAKLTAEVRAAKAGYLVKLDARTVGRASVVLGAGRARAEDAVDFGAGIMLCRKIGDRVAAGEITARLYASDAAKLREGKKMFESALETGPRPPRKTRLIKEIIR